VIPAELDEPLVQRVRDEIVVVAGRRQCAVQVGLELDGRAHAAELEVAQPELGEAQPGLDARVVQLVVGRVNAGAFQELKRYTVANSATWAQPVVSGNRILIKDVSSLSLWTIN
jgi:hypothetical protein